MVKGRKIRVLVVDDSAIVRTVLSGILDAEPDMEVVGTAPDPIVARDKILALSPDVLTLDIEMPRMDGLSFLDRLMAYRPMPVIVVSSLAQASTKIALDALSKGAVDVLAKPGGPYSVGDLKDDLPHRIRAAISARLRKPMPAADAAHDDSRPPRGAASRESSGCIVALGASTGGTRALETILRALPKEMPPVLVVQHIPPGFSAAFAKRLKRVCALEVNEASGGERLTSGQVLIAPGNRHLLIDRTAPSKWRVRLEDSAKVCFQRPSVDVLFDSVMRSGATRKVAALLTGMGEDGAQGLLALRESGAHTIAQDEASCVVFGMPREAIQRGGAGVVLPLEAIAEELVSRTRSSLSDSHRASAPALSENGRASA